MLKYCLTIVMFALGVFATTAQTHAKNDFTWGINGHPLTKTDYNGNLTEQINTIKDLKLSSYRFDVLLDTKGYAKNESRFSSLLKILKKNAISPLPTVMQSGFKDMDISAIYDIAYKQGSNFASTYGEYLSVIEVGNEGDNKTILSAKVDGTNASHYNIVKARRLLTATKGFIDGLKSIKPEVRVTLSFSWIHFYYLQMLKEFNVNYDIIGYHWYSNMGDITNARSYGNVLTLVSKRFNKPIWITEFNYFKGTTIVNFARQNQYITNSLQKILSQGIISGFFIYELYDQPALKRRYSTEACYGLIYKDSTGNYNKKEAYLGYKQLVEKYMSSSF